MKVHQFIQDEITLSGVKALTIAGLLEQFANSAGEAELPSQKRQAWNIAQDLREKTK
jgi:hypothetical protein